MRSGYVRVWEPDHPLATADGYVMEHRKVVFDAGIPVPPGFHVHHRNGDKTDNALDNLEVISNSDHHAEHHRPGAVVRNQYGEFIMGAFTEEERAERRRAHSRNNQRKRAAGMWYDKATGRWEADRSTWGGYGGYATAGEAPPEVQDAWAAELQRTRGNRPWPVCGR